MLVYVGLTIIEYGCYAVTGYLLYDVVTTVLK